jgi:hypothetical protein
VILKLDQRRRDDDAKRGSTGSWSRRKEKFRVDAAGLGRDLPARNTDLFELPGDRRADCNDVRGEAVDETCDAENAGGQPPVESEKGRNPDETDRAGRKSLEVIAVEVREVRATAVPGDICDGRGQKETRDQRSRQPAIPHGAEQ